MRREGRDASGEARDLDGGTAHVVIAQLRAGGHWNVRQSGDNGRSGGIQLSHTKYW